MYPRYLDKLLDPLNMLNNFANTEWNNNTYRNQKFKDYDWYLYPPYIQLLLNHQGSIDLLNMAEPSTTVLDSIYTITNKIHTEDDFYNILKSRIEENQLKNFVNPVWKDPILSDHPDPDNLFPTIVEFPWHKRYLYAPPLMLDVYKWYMFPPFLHIAIFYKDKIDIINMDEPIWSSLDSMLSIAYDSISCIDSTSMRRFYDNLIADLKSYLKTKVSATKPTRPSVIYAPLPQSIEDNIDTVTLMSEQPVSDKRPISPLIDFLSTPRDPNSKTYKRLKKISDTTTNTNINNRIDNNMIIVSNNESLEPQYPDMINQILLDSGCSYHLIRDQNDVQNFVGNDDKDSLGLGVIHLGNGVTVSISGYGNRFPFGRMLVVPNLLYKIILSAGLLVAHDCKLEFSDTKARLINKQGYLLLTAVRQSNHLYYVNKVGKGFKDTFNTETPLPNLLIPIYCLVLSSGMGNNNNSSSTSSSIPTSAQQI